MTNTGDRPQRRRLEPPLIADIGPAEDRGVGADIITALITGCSVRDVQVVDRATGTRQTIADRAPRA